MTSQELVRLTSTQPEEIVRRVNSLLDMQLGNVGTRSRLIGQDGTRRNIAGGASIATGEYAQIIQSVAAGGPHLAVLHSGTANGATVAATAVNAVLLVRDDYLAIGMQKTIRFYDSVGTDYAELTPSATGGLTLGGSGAGAGGLTISTLNLAALTTAGDLLYGTGSGATARLPIGTARQGLLTNVATTAPEWGASLQSLMTTTGDIVAASAANTPARVASATGVLHGAAGVLPSYSTVATADIAADAVTQADYSDGPASAVDTTSQTFVDVHATSSNIAITTTGGDLLVVAVAGVTNTTSITDRTQIAVQINAADYAGSAQAAINGAGIVITIPYTRVITGVPAGSHNLKGRFRNVDSAITTARVDGFRMSVVELKR